MVLCSEDNVVYTSSYNHANNMNSYGYSPQPQEHYTNQMGNQDAYSNYQVSYSDPNIQQLAQSASWAGVYAARSGHGTTSQGNIIQGQGALLEEWSSPAPQQQYCTSSNSDSSPSPNGFSYAMSYRSPMSGNVTGMDYGMPSPRQTPTPTGHGAGVSVIATHHTNPCPVGDRAACQGSPTGARPLRPPYDWMKRQTYHAVPSAGKTRTKDKYRVVYSDHQRLELEKEFHYSRYITIRRKAELAQNLSLSERQVKIWFQNRRAKERKQKKKEDILRGVQVITEVPLQGQTLAPAQSVQIHSVSQTTLPSPEMNQSQTPHLTHTRAQTQEMMRQEEIPNNSSLEVLRP